MVRAIAFPEFDPVAFWIPFLDLPIRWYALAYIAGLLIGWRYIAYLAGRDKLWPGGRRPLAPEQTDDLLFYMTLGVVLGGRLGFVLFYRPDFLWTFSEEPILGVYLPRALEIWRGGMAFHGGMLGVLVAGLIYARRAGAPAWSLGDAVACAAPFGIFFGRIANFVNGELWGRPTDASWGVIFPQIEDPSYLDAYPQMLVNGENVPRHPSQLYEAGLEGLLLAAVLLWLVWRRDALKIPGLCVGVFLAGYGLARFVAEFWRQYDPWLGFDFHLLGVGFTRGQTLSFPMIVLGLGVIAYALWRANMAGGNGRPGAPEEKSGGEDATRA